MSERIINLLNSLFSVCVIIAVAGGVVSFLLFAVATVIGSETLAVNTGTVYIPYFIKAASIAIGCGLVTLYISKSHFLSLDTEQKDKKR